MYRAIRLRKKVCISSVQIHWSPFRSGPIQIMFGEFCFIFIIPPIESKRICGVCVRSLAIYALLDIQFPFMTFQFRIDFGATEYSSVMVNHYSYVMQSMREWTKKSQSPCWPEKIRSILRTCENTFFFKSLKLFLKNIRLSWTIFKKRGASDWSNINSKSQKNQNHAFQPHMNITVTAILNHETKKNHCNCTHNVKTNDI